MNISLLNSSRSTQPFRTKTVLSLLLLMLLSLSGLISGSTSLAAEKIPSENLLPRQVYAYFSFPNVTALKEAINKSSSGELLKDKAFADIRADIEAKLKEVSGQMESKAGISLMQLANVPTGEVAFAYLLTSREKPALITILDFGESRSTLDKLLTKAEETLKAKGAKQTVEEVDGAKIHIFQMNENAANNEEGNDDSNLKDQMAYVIKDNSFVLGSSPEILKDVLARWDGKHESTFASNDVYKYIMSQCVPEGSTSQFKWYFDPLGTVRSAMSAVGAMNPQVAMGMAMLPVLGVTKMKAVGGSVEIGGEKYESVNRALMYVDLPAEGLLQIFECPPTAQAPPKWVKSNAASYVGINWDADNAYAAVRTMVDNFQGPGAFDRIVDGVTKNENAPNIHPKKDIIDQLKGGIHYVFFPSEEVADLEKLAQQSSKFLLAFDLINADKMKGTLDQIAKTPGFPGEIRQFKGETIYEIPLGNLAPQGARVGAPEKLGICVTKNCLMMTSSLDDLEGVIRGNDDQQALVDSASYKRVAADFPEKTSIIMYQDQNAQLKSVWEVIRKNPQPAIGIDITKLPPFTAIAKYLKPQGSYIAPNKNGVMMTSFQLK